MASMKFTGFKGVSAIINSIDRNHLMTRSPRYCLAHWRDAMVIQRQDAKGIGGSHQHQGGDNGQALLQPELLQLPAVAGGGLQQVDG